MSSDAPRADAPRGLRTRAPFGNWMGWRGAASLILLSLALYLPGLTGIPAIDRDESRFAQASRQMLAAQHVTDLLVPKLQDRYRLNKPPLIYWLQAASAAVFTRIAPTPTPDAANPASNTSSTETDAIWMYRVPSLLAAVAAVLITWRLGSLIMHPAPAWLGAALFAACPVLIWESKQARADMLLLACTTASMFWLFKLYRSAGKPTLALTAAFWLSLTAAVLAKGPVAPMIAALTALAIGLARRDWRLFPNARFWLGVPLLVAIVGAWVYAVARQIGFEQYTRIVIDETLGRSLEPKEGHGGPPGYHFVAMHIIFVPAVIGIGLGIRHALRAEQSPPPPTWRAKISWLRTRLQNARPSDLFLLAWIIPAWIVFESIGTKLPHYPLPLYPALALLSARALSATAAHALRPHSGPHPIFRLAAAVGCIVLIAIVAAASLLAAIVLSRSTPGSSGLLISGAIALVITLGVGTRLLRDLARRRYLNLAVGGVLSMIVASALLGVGLSGLREIRTSRNIANLIGQVPDWRSRPIGLVRYHEDSLIFESHGHALRVQDASAVDWFASRPNSIVVVQDDALSLVPPFRTIGIVEGFNYSKGKPVKVHVGEILAPPRPDPLLPNPPPPRTP